MYNIAHTGLNAEVAEQADALRSGRSGLYARVGSTPTFGIKTARNVHIARYGPFLFIWFYLVWNLQHGGGEVRC